jgi:lipopolysaccharide export LptBFGC system permease protein LptF
MPEDELETSEIKEQLDQTNERAEVAEMRPGWIVYLSFSTALIAVLAAIASLESGAYSNDALLLKNEALLAQTKAADQWAYYQAKSVKGAIYSSQASQLLTSNPELATKAKKEAERYAREEEEISKTANELEKHANEESERSSESMEHHHRFAYAVTMFQISIALAAVAALSRQRAMWFAGLVVALMGLVYFVDGFQLFF